MVIPSDGSDAAPPSVAQSRQGARRESRQRLLSVDAEMTQLEMREIRAGQRWWWCCARASREDKGDGGSWTRERVWMLVVCALCVVISVSVLLLMVPFDGTGQGGLGLESGGGLHNATLERAWQQHAERLRNYSDHSVSPCDDFYQHVCGGWLRATQLPPGASSVSLFDSDTDARVAAELLELVQEEWPLLGTWWDSCMDQQARAAAGIDAVQPLLEMASNVQSVDTLSQALAVLHSVGVPALFAAVAVPDERQPNRPRMTLYYPQMGAARSVWLAPSNDTLAAAQRQALHSMVAAVLGEDAAQQALALEGGWLAGATLSAADQRERPINYSSQAVLADLLPPTVFNWPLYWQHALGEELAAAPALDEVGLYDAGYWPQLAAALRATPWHGLRAYLQYTVVLHYAHAFPNASGLMAGLRAARDGSSPPSPQGECLSSVASEFPDLLGHYYVSRYFSPSAKQAALAVVHRVLEAMGERLAVLSWMDPMTRAHALAKLTAIRPYVGYPDQWSPDLPPVPLTEQDYLLNWVEMDALQMAQNWALLTLDTLPSGPPGWDMPVYVVNAYYDPLQNDIVFPAGILQGGFFSELLPYAANYGGLGAVAGHEVSHGFDDEGRLYDADGARRDWWSPASAAAFEERAQCVVDLYSAFETPYGPVDGTLTLGENMADLGGLAVAYQAYHDVLDDPATWSSPSAPFPTRLAYERHVERVYTYPANQLFYRTWAASWCSLRSPQRASELLHQDPHSPARWRVNGPASQSADFAVAFGCPLPAEADVCQLW